MSNRQHDGACLVERSRPPLRVWGHYLIPVLLLALPVPFTGVVYWSVAAALAGLWILAVVILIGSAAGRSWWVTPEELGVRPVPRPFWALYGVTEDRRVPFPDIASVEVRQGRSREIQRHVFGSEDAAVRENPAGCEKFWATGAVIVRLHKPDKYGETILLSTDRPQQACAVLSQGVANGQERRGTTP